MFETNENQRRIKTNWTEYKEIHAITYHSALYAYLDYKTCRQLVTGNIGGQLAFKILPGTLNETVIVPDQHTAAAVGYTVRVFRQLEWWWVGRKTTTTNNMKWKINVLWLLLLLSACFLQPGSLNCWFILQMLAKIILQFLSLSHKSLPTHQTNSN